MIPRSAAFDVAAIQSHHPVFAIEVLDPTGSGAVLLQLDPDGGSVTIERTGRSCEFTVRGRLADLVPTGTDPKILLPYGTEVRVLRGIDLDGTPELLSLGIFRLIEVETDVDLEEGIGVRFTCEDRFERLSRELIAAFSAPEHSNTGDVIVQLLTLAWTGASSIPSAPPFRMTDTPHTTPTLHFEAKTNAGDEGRELATASGKELFADYEGAIAFVDLPTLDDAPVWDFADGTRDTRVRLGRRYSSANTPNHITVNGSGADDEEISGVAFVVDPITSIDVNGAYGTVGRWLDSPYVTSNEQAVDQARAELAKVLAGTDTLEIDAVPHPALCAGDVVTVTCELLDIFDERYIVSAIDLPLDLDSTMHVTVGRG